MGQIADRGQLLYQEDWSKKRRFQEPADYYFGLFIMIMGCIVIALGIIFLFTPEWNPLLSPLLFIMGIILVWGGKWLFSNQIKKMPFKIYEKGFTTIETSPDEKRNHEGEFVSWNRVNRVKLEDQSIMTMNTKIIRIVYDFLKYNRLDLDYSTLSDPFEVMMIFREHIPEKMDEKFNNYYGTQNEQREIKRPLPIKPDRYEWIGFYFCLLFIAGILGYGLSMMTITTSAIIASIFVVCFFGGAFIVLFKGSLSNADKNQREMIRANARATETGIVLTRIFPSHLIFRFQQEVPYSEIKIIRMKLDPIFYSHEAQFETFHGERYLVPYSIYKTISKRSDFIAGDFSYKNITSFKSAEPVIALNKIGLGLLFVILFSPIFIGLRSPSGLLDTFSYYFRILFLLFIIFVALPVYAYNINLIEKRNKMSIGMHITENGIFLPNAPEALRFIPRIEFISAKSGNDLFSPYCEVRAVKGTLKMAHLAAELLKEAGYPIEGTN